MRDAQLLFNARLIFSPQSFLQQRLPFYHFLYPRGCLRAGRQKPALRLLSHCIGVRAGSRFRRTPGAIIRNGSRACSAGMDMSCMPISSPEYSVGVPRRVSSSSRAARACARPRRLTTRRIYRRVSPAKEEKRDRELRSNQHPANQHDTCAKQSVFNLTLTKEHPRPENGQDSTQFEEGRDISD